MRLPSKINHLLRDGVSDADKIDLRLRLDDLRALDRVIHRAKRRGLKQTQTTKPATQPKIARTKTGKCVICRAQKPHMTRDAIRFHFYELQRRVPTLAGIARWRQIGFDVLGRRSGQVRRAKGIEKRLRIFQEMAPHAYNVLGRDLIVSKILGRLNNRGWLRTPYEFRAWVRRNYNQM